MFPRTLLARLFLLLALLMTISVLTWASIFSLSEQEPRARQLAQLLTSVANLTRSAVVAAAPERRRDLLTELSRQEGIRIDVAEDDETLDPPPEDPFMRRVQQRLRQTLGPDTQLLLKRGGERALFLRVDIEGDRYWIALPRERFNQHRSFQWLGWGMLAAAIALLAAGAFVSRLTRPLRLMAGAAREIGAGRHPPPLPCEGPEELATVAQAINQMNADLARIEQDRALILAGISHDLRTPLTRLRMGVEMSGAEESLREGMMADVEEMDRTIGQFLDFARTDGGEPLALVNLAALIEDLVAQYRRRGTENLALALENPVHATVRPLALRRAIANLIDNALRHAGSGQPIDIALHRQEQRIFIEVRDRGPGIPAAEIERLKRPFTRLETARANPVGAGLGLAIVDRIARQHDGTLDLLPGENGGLIACVTIAAR